MPYLLQNSQNRVENIKKKFENPYFYEEESGKTRKDRESLGSHTRNDRIQVLKNGQLEHDNENHEKIRLKYSNKSDGNRGDGKAVVKRSPAFRREKLNYAKATKSLSDVNAQLSHNKILTEDLKVPFRENNYCEVGDVKKLKNVICKNNTEPNLLQLSQSAKFSCHINDNLVSDSDTNPIELANKEKDKNHKNIINDKILVQCSHTNNNNNNNSCSSKIPDKSVTSTSKYGLKITDSIRLALKAPLPKGPPPKKPPRTFVHTMNDIDTSLINQNSSMDLQKDDSVLRLKLKKIENVIKSLDERVQTNIICDNNKTELGKSSAQLTSIKTNTIPQALHGQPSNAFSFKSLKCFSFEGYEKPFLCDEELKKQSSFYIDHPKDGKDCNKTDVNSHINGNPTLSLAKRSGSEHIYDLPCITKKSSFESFGKSTREGEISNSPQHLHYMCTDLVNPIKDTKTPKFLVLDQGNIIGGNPPTETKNDRAKIKLNKHHTSQSNCQEFKFNDIKKEKNEFVGVKDELKTIMHTAFNAPNHNLKNIKRSSSDIDSDLDSISSGFEDSHFNVSEESDLVHAGQSRMKTDDGYAHATNNKKNILTRQTSALRKTYVKRVSSNILKRSPYTKGLPSESYDHLFESCILVGLTLAESKTTVPYIKSIFPPNVKPPPLIEYLCFPDASTWSQSNCYLQQGEQYYSLVITNENGYRKFGYCRRVLPEGGNFCLPLVYCITSPHRANGFYYKVLQELESRHGSSELQAFIKQLYECNFPGPGQSLKFKKILEEVTRVSPIKMNDCLPSTLVRRPCDVRLEERDLSQLLQHLKVSILLKVFSSLLLERKVLLLGRSLRNLSCCIEALQSLLIPFSWQHTFIPVLPNTLNEMCDAPTPYVIGLQKSTITDEFLSNLNFEDGIMVDLEESNIIKCCGDEGSIIPQRLIKGLKTALNLALSASLESDNDRNVLISEAFIRFFVEICGNYSHFIIKQPSGKKIFQKEEFINSMPAIQPFLDWFVETAMFRCFIQERLENNIEDLFKKRALEHLDEADKNAALLSKNYKGVNRKVKSIGDRIKDLTLFSK